MKYRKKPVVINAWVWEPHGNADLIPLWAQIRIIEGTIQINDDDTLDIKTLEGTMKCNPGDYVIRGVAGEIYSCKPDIFALTYESIDE